MGTGPWPQPPTEAEQLQALMAAANGESCTSLSFIVLAWPPLPHPPSIYLLARSARCLYLGGGGVWACCLGLLLEGNKPDWLIDSPCVYIDFFFFRVEVVQRTPSSEQTQWARLAAAL